MMIPRLGLTRFSKLNSTVASNVAWKQSVPLSTTTKPLPIAATMVKWNKCLKNDWLSRSNKSLAFFSTKIDSKEKQSKNVSKVLPVFFLGNFFANVFFVSFSQNPKSFQKM